MTGDRSLMNKYSFMNKYSAPAGLPAQPGTVREL
jgi:hypothetical protein